MPTAIVVPTGIRAMGVHAVVNYGVVILDPPNLPQEFHTEYRINGGHGKTGNVPAWKDKIVADAADHGVAITTDNIILWGE